MHESNPSAYLDNIRRILFQNDAKAMLHPLLNQLGLDKWEVIGEMTEAEIFADVRTLIDEIVAL